MSTLHDGTVVAITAGEPTPEEVAAVVAALDAARAADAQRREARRPAWLRAARREAVEGRLVASPGDLR